MEMEHIKLFEDFDIVDPIKYGEPLNNREINFLKGYNVICPEFILKDDNYYYVYDHRCENIKDLPLTYIHGICKEFNITNYTINDDYTIDVDGSVSISNRRSLTKIPLKFNKVSKHFNCDHSNLTTLEGSPESVGWGFWCYSNQLTTLEGCPKKVGTSFDCSENKLTTLEGCPKEVVGDFNCAWNKLTTLKGGPEEVGGSFNCSNNQLITLEGSPEYVGGNFICRDNKLTTLKGGPEDVGGNFICYNNPLTSIKYKGIIKGSLIYT